MSNFWTGQWTTWWTRKESALFLQVSQGIPLSSAARFEGQHRLPRREPGLPGRCRSSERGAETEERGARSASFFPKYPMHPGRLTWTLKTTGW